MSWGINPLGGGAAYLTQLPPGSFSAFDKMLGSVPLWQTARTAAGNPETFKVMFSQIDANAPRIAQLGAKWGIENGPTVLKDGITSLMKGFSSDGATGLMGALKGILGKCPNFLGFLKDVSNLIPGLGLIVSLATSLPTLLDPNATAAQKTAALLSIAGGVVGLIPGGGVVGTALNVASTAVSVLQKPVDDVLTKVGTGLGLSINGFPAHMDFEKEANELIAKFERQGNTFPSFRVPPGRYGGV